MSKFLYRAAVNICAVLLAEVLLRDYVKCKTPDQENSDDNAQQ